MRNTEMCCQKEMFNHSLRQKQNGYFLLFM